LVAVGEPVDLETLRRLSAPADTEDGERRGLLVWENEASRPVVRLAHPLYAETLLRRMPTSRRRSIVRALADTFAETGADRTEGLLRYVSWRLDIGEEVPSAALLQAARRALEAMDLPLAERLARASVGAGGHTRERIFLAGVHYRQGRGSDALKDLDGINPRDDRQRTEIAALRVYVLLWTLGRAQDAEVVLDRAIERATEPDSRAWLDAIRANLLNFGGYPAEAVAVSAPLVEDGDLPPRPLLAAISALGPGLALSGRGDEAVRIAERGIDPVLRGADEVGGSINWAVGTVFLAHLGGGNLDQAEEVASLQYETALSLRSKEAHGGGATSLGWVALLRGRVATAARYFRAAEPHLRQADLFGIRTACLGGLAHARALAGDERRAAEALRHAEASSLPGVRWLDASADLGRAWTRSIRDRAAGARMCLDAGDTAHDRGQLPFAAIAFHDAARLGAAAEAAASLREVATHSYGPFPRAAVAHVEALIAHDSAGLLASADAFEELGMLLLAAEAVVEAQQLEARHRRRRLAARAAALVANCEGARTPTLGEMVKGSTRLTDRELAVARLASEGHSSRAIARQLAVSVRTVDSHLTRVYSKLGVAGRQDLTLAISSGSSPAPED
jgi:DNA-binding CsgD family transcriptional regulator/tetratricopeptide (TPR) repeat protein